MVYLRVGKTGDVPRGAMKHFEVEGNEYLVANVDGNFYAISNRCTHFGAQLSEGTLDGRVVTCPKHHSSFDVITGESLSIHTHDVAVYQVKVEGDDLLIEN